MRRAGTLAGTVVLVLLTASLFAGSVGPSPFPGLPASPPPRAPSGTSAVEAHAGTASTIGTPWTLSGIHQALRGRGVPSGDLHAPALTAEGPRTGSPVQPTYASAPAPMGVADVGLRDVKGTLAGYELNTSSAEGTASLTDAQSVYLDGDGPDLFGLQLNAVLTGVTLFGNSSYEFWAQDFVSYTSSSGALSFGDNLWNFSSLSGTLSSNALYAHGPNGTVVAPVFYYAEGPSFTIGYPFEVRFYLNATEIQDRPAVYFNYSVSNASFRAHGSFDYVVFNSSVGAPTGPAPSALFQIDGNGYDPVGLINDLELAVLGNGNGDTTTFFEIDGTLSLDFWNATAGAYQPVPSAVNAGADTGETADGVASYYLGGSPVAHLGSGPSFLSGLWNTTTAPGIRKVVSSVAPAPVLILVNPGTARNATTAQWVPSSPSGTTSFFVPNTGAFFLDYLLSEYAPSGYLLPNGGANGTTTVSGNLANDPSLGVYTPIVAWGNAELAVFAVSGNGSPRSPYVLVDQEPGPLYPEFTQWNDFDYPVFPGLLLIETTAYARIAPPPFRVDLPVTLCGPPSDPICVSPVPNDLQIEFWNVSHAVLENATITGWLSADLAPYPVGAAILWNSTDNLVANLSFLDQGVSLVLYGGGGNVVWGNSFRDGSGSLADPAPVLGGPGNQTGLLESESGDLVYNNLFEVPVPAYTPTLDPLSCPVTCVPAQYRDLWNVSRAPADAVRTVLGIALSGSLIGTSYQGGNYWSNYGTPSDPYGDLPYVDRLAGSYPPAAGAIAIGGDELPLVPFPLYLVSFSETGLPAGSSWEVNSTLADLGSSGGPTSLEAPNGTYPIQVRWSTSSTQPYSLIGPTQFTVDGSNRSVVLRFVPYAPVTFRASGLEGSSWWTVALYGTNLSGPSNVSSSNRSIVFDLGVGNYSFDVTSSGYSADPSSGNLSLSNGSAESVDIAFTGRPVPLWLDLVSPRCGQVTIDGGPSSGAVCGSYRANVTPGIAHQVEVAAEGYDPYFLNVTLYVGAPSEPINISLTPLPVASSPPPIGSEGWLVIGGLTALAVVLAVALLFRRGRRLRPPLPPFIGVPVPGASGSDRRDVSPEPDERDD